MSMQPGRPLSIVFVATRFPAPAKQGRQVMLMQSLRFSQALGAVHLAYCEPEACDHSLLQLSEKDSAIHLPPPSMGEALADFARYPLDPLQSHFVAGQAALKRLTELINVVQPDVIIIDMLRLVGVAKRLRATFPDLPMVLELDDLLSLRYRRALHAHSPAPLGSYGRRLPRLVQRLARYAPRLALVAEARLMARAETRSLQVFDAITAVSEREAAILRRRLKASRENVITSVPPTVSAGVLARKIRSSAVLQDETLRCVFIGDARYGPNAETITSLDRIAGQMPDDVSISFQTAGTSNPSLALKHVEQRGFVPDIGTFLGGRTILVAPIWQGSGIKLKILDAVAQCVPVATTPIGLEGLQLRSGSHCWVGEDERAFADYLTAIAHGHVPWNVLVRRAKAAQSALATVHAVPRVEPRFAGTVRAAIAHRLAAV